MSAIGCTKLAGLKLESLEKCYQGEQGQKLDAAAHNETDGLQPPHTYVPWVSAHLSLVAHMWTSRSEELAVLQRMHGGMG